MVTPFTLLVGQTPPSVQLPHSGLSSASIQPPWIPLPSPALVDHSLNHTLSGGYGSTFFALALPPLVIRDTRYGRAQRYPLPARACPRKILNVSVGGKATLLIDT